MVSGFWSKRKGAQMLLEWNIPGKRTFIHQRILKAGKVHIGGNDERETDKRTTRAADLHTEGAKGPGWQHLLSQVL